MVEGNQSDLRWISRCFDLARKGIGSVSPNPPVGAVLVHEDKILAEGYHHYFGGAHAEVEAVKNVPAHLQHLVSKSILYVSLEPCCITGKTPPCTNLIIDNGIKDVRVSVADPNPNMAGKAISLLRQHGVHVDVGIRQEEGAHLIRAFRTNILKKKPYVILKWAQSKFGIAGFPGQQVWFSQPHTQVWSHQLRATYDAIIVGARTVETDNPSLTTRDYPGRSPARVIYDPNGRLHANYNVFKADGCKIFYFTSMPHTGLTPTQHLNIFTLSSESGHAAQMLSILFQHTIGSIVVEGGSFVHQLFIRENCWDEAWVVKTQHEMASGITAPNLRGRLIQNFSLENDTIVGMYNEQLT